MLNERHSPEEELTPKMADLHHFGRQQGDDLHWYFHASTGWFKVHRSGGRGSCDLTSGEVNLFPPNVLYDFVLERTVGQESETIEYPKWGTDWLL